MKMKSFLSGLSVIALIYTTLIFGSVCAFASDDDVLTAVDAANGTCIELIENDCVPDAVDIEDDLPQVMTADTKNNSPKKQKSVSWGKIIAVSIIVSAIATLITVFMIFNGYKHNGKSEPYPYDKKAPLELTDSEDILVDTDIRRERRERNDN